MSTTIGEFALNLIVDAGKGELTLNNLVAQMGELEVASVGEIAVLAELAKTLISITEATIHTSMGLELYTHQTGASTQALEEWQSAARHTSVSADTVAQSFLTVSEKMEDLKKGAGPSDLLNVIKFLHISLDGLNASNPEKFMERVHAAILKTKLSADQLFALRHSGLGGMLEVFQMPMEKFDRAKMEAGSYSQRELDKYQEMHDEMATIENTAIRIKRVIADWFSEGVIESAKGFSENFKWSADVAELAQKTLSPLKTGETAVTRKNEVAPMATQFIIDFFFKHPDLIKRMFENQAPGVPNYPAMPMKEPKTAQNNFNTTNHFNGSKMSHAELADAVASGISSVHQRVAAQLDNGALA